jgi:hypothetical protein
MCFAWKQRGRVEADVARIKEDGRSRERSLLTVVATRPVNWNDNAARYASAVSTAGTALRTAKFIPRSNGRLLIYARVSGVVIIL